MSLALHSYEKKAIALRYWMLGKGFLKGVEAMEFAQSIHTGFRKDGVTPEFSHQVSIASFVRTLVPSLRHPEETLATVMLHDTIEDYNVSPDEIRHRFGERVAEATWGMTKVYREEKRDEKELFAAMAQNPISSIAKGCDRVHNLQSMLGVFSVGKQKSYVAEGRDLFIPMLKQARRNFPDQEMAYENIKHLLHSQMELLDCAHSAMDS